MSRLAKIDKEILITLKGMLRDNKRPDRDTISKSGRNMFERGEGWTGGLERLVSRGLLTEGNGLFSFTRRGKARAEKFHKDFYRHRYNKALSRFLHSRTYGAFCERVFGMNLCQVSMMDMKQLHRLISLLKLSRNDRALDVGCGNGKITEYISDTTGACMTGIDFADRAIKMAQQRTIDKRNRLVFKVGDMDDLKFKRYQFSAIICIDALYFVENLDRTVGAMRPLLKPGGQMGIFYTQSVKPEESKKRLQPGFTGLAQVLKAQHLEFRAYDYTKDEHMHWRKRIEMANLLKSRFEKEGNSEIYNKIMKEAEHVLRFIGTGRLRRYLYHVKA